MNENGPIWFNPLPWILYLISGGVSPSQALGIARSAVVEAGGYWNGPFRICGGWRHYQIITDVRQLEHLSISVRRRDGAVVTLGLGDCGSCGYDLTGIEGMRCPECGTPIDLVNVKWGQRMAPLLEFLADALSVSERDEVSMLVRRGKPREAFERLGVLLAGRGYRIRSQLGAEIEVLGRDLHANLSSWGGVVGMGCKVEGEGPSV